MKYTTLLLFGLMLTLTTANAQTSTNAGKLGISFSSLGNSQIINSNGAVGTGSHEGERFFSLGINYTHPLKKWLDIEVAAEYSKFTMKYNPPFHPGTANNSHNEQISLLSLPVTLRANFLNYFYANSGLLIDISLDSNSSTNINNQSGIGAMAGIGAEYDLASGTSIFLNPYVKFHSMIPFSQLNSIEQKLWEAGVRFGVSIPLAK
ncbi:MAG: hypothetical protein FH748_06675 [Balneolaceae bacterium]|nr:hypothetical protein [Balneolaceae bacterium]